MKNSVKNRGDVDRTVRVVWWVFANMKKPALLVKVTHRGAYLVWYSNTKRGLRFSIEPMDGQALGNVTDCNPRKTIAAFRRVGKITGMSKKVTAALKEAHAAL